jgi:hypothetical protein
MTVKVLRRILLSCIPLMLLVTCSSYPELNNIDKIYIEKFLADWKLAASAEAIHSSFENEIAFISKVQDSVVANITHAQIPSKSFASIAYYYNNHKGYCYDRAVLMEKIFSYYNFSYRHAFVYFGKNKRSAGFWDLFKKNIPSHALLEVKTKKGWMVVGTNENVLGVDSNNEVMNLSILRRRLQTGQLTFVKKRTGIIPFWKDGVNFKYVYGLYSRHGEFFKSSNNHSYLGFLEPSRFVPDYNLKMLLYNF